MDIMAQTWPLHQPAGLKEIAEGDMAVSPTGARMGERTHMAPTPMADTAEGFQVKPEKKIDSLYF